MTSEDRPARERPAEEEPSASQPASEPGTTGAGGLESWPAVGTPADRSPSIAPSLRASNADRNAIAERLRDAFTDGRLDEEEFDVRIQAALSARTRADLEPLLADLGTYGATSPMPSHAPSPPVASGDGPRHAWVVAVMGGAERKGRWRMPAEATAVAIMGGVVLDLRAATLTSQVTTIRAAALMGGVDVIVPPGVRVEMNGIPLMGGGENRVDDDHLPLTAPLVKIQYFALMGGVSVRTKAPKGKEGRQLPADRHEQLRANRERLHEMRHELRQERRERRQGWERSD
jgi:hypothetical protein